MKKIPPNSRAKKIFIGGLFGFFASCLVVQLFDDKPQIETTFALVGGICLLTCLIAAGVWLFEVCLKGYREGMLRVIGEWASDTRILHGKTARIVAVIGMVTSTILIGTVAFISILIVASRFS